MKYLPCSTCRQPALATAAGILHTAGRLSSPKITYVCKRCSRVTSLTAAAFEILPEMTRDEILHITCDLRHHARTLTP